MGYPAGALHGGPTILTARRLSGAAPVAAGLGQRLVRRRRLVDNPAGVLLGGPALRTAGGGCAVLHSGWSALPDHLTRMRSVALGARSPGHGVSVAVLDARTVLELKVIRLEGLQPAGELSLGFFETLQPLQGSMIRPEQEPGAREEMPVRLAKVHHSQELPAGDAVSPLGLAECPATVRDDPFLAVAHLGQDCSDPHVRCVCVQDERQLRIWIPEDGCRGQEVFQLVEGG